MPGVLYLVATPIGNLDDITLRALRVLKDVAVVAAEDTRRSRQLLTHFGLSTPLISVRQHNERDLIPRLLKRLRSGESIALVSDAGTPLISDPGAALVKEARSADIRVEAIPGASAVLTALAASSLADHATGAFLFVGFMPNQSKDRDKVFAVMADSSVPIVFFEAPHRIRQTLEAWSQIGGDRLVAVCRELTKVHESIVVAKSIDSIDLLGEVRGEYTVVVEASRGASRDPIPVDEALLYDEFCRLTETASSRRAAIAALAAKYGRPQREIYRIVSS